MSATVCILALMVLFSSVTASRNCLHRSKAAIYSSSSILSAGTCGYGSKVLHLNRGFVAAAGSDLYCGGSACGKCFQIKCKNTRLCNSDGVKVMVTDHNKNHQAGFMLTGPAFTAMARAGMANNLEELAIVDVEYKKIPCEYQKRMIRVEESSRRPNNLAIRFVGVQTGIVAVDVARAGSSEWQSMNRSHGVVWATNRAPAGSLQLRLVVMGGEEGKWMWAEGEVLPAQWRAGAVYNSGVRFSDPVVQEDHTECEDEGWK